MKLHRYVDHQRLHIVTKDVISLSISVLLLFRHYISHKIILVPPAVAGYYAVLAVLLLNGSSSFVGNKDFHKSLNEFDFPPHPSTSYRVSCP